MFLSAFLYFMKIYQDVYKRQAYTYNEADTMIRKLYRDGELCPERQDAK